MNRQRREGEPFGDYREALKNEAAVMKWRLKGKWVWKTFYPIDENTTELPRNAQVYSKNPITGAMELSTGPAGVQYVKFPPYVKETKE